MSDYGEIRDLGPDNDGSEYWMLRAKIEALRAENERLREALALAAASMTCNGHNGRDEAHYCPNCSNNMYGPRDSARLALGRTSHE